MNTRPFAPEQPLHCLLVYPEFSPHGFWNYREACELQGSKSPSPPLGLITVAAILPQHWEFHLVDLNTATLRDEDWQWADLVAIGGMLVQQGGILALIQEAKRRGVFSLVGGADPSSQPELYTGADALLTGEAEASVPLWLEAWRQGQARGRFDAKEKPDVTKTPMPRYDLLTFRDYANIGIQYSRGCPFSCEFCDIIELYGRVPRTKTPEQMTAELERIYQLGYRGLIEVVDDNFIGNKRNVKRHLLPAIIAWNQRRRYPFAFMTEASMNLADDDALLELMRDAEFRMVFMGIETPDPRLLLQTQKSQNTMRPIVERIHKVYRYGIGVSAGFIMGFDNEAPGVDEAMIRCIEETAIVISMVGLLVALPNTQLTRRLIKEGRLLNMDGTPVPTGTERYVMRLAANDGVDQTSTGLNFVTTRPRDEIIDEYIRVLRTVFSPENYMNRALRMVSAMQMRRRHKPTWQEARRSIPAFFRLAWRMSKIRENRRLFWRCVRVSLRLGLQAFEQCMIFMAMYLHLQKKVVYNIAMLEAAKDRHQRGEKQAS